MSTPLERKSNVDAIRDRFDHDVERFADLETGQQAIIDAPLAMELIARAATASNPRARRVLDIGCGAGNNTLKLLQFVHPLDCDLVDLSRPMLDRARSRVEAANAGGRVRTFQGDMRGLDVPNEGYDVILTAAVLHHLREEADWEAMFAKLYAMTAPGGSVWITDMVSHEGAAVQEMMWARYGEYLESLGGPEYRAKVFAYIDQEDSPRPVTYQIDLLRQVGFAEVDLLHKNSCFAAFGARRQA